MGTSLKVCPLVLLSKFPFNWDPRRVGTIISIVMIVMNIIGFHSIGIPGEWGQDNDHVHWQLSRRVSIQLGSPASGDFKATE